MAIMSLASMSSKLTTPLSASTCAEASPASVIGVAPVTLIVGASFWPVTVMVTVAVSVRPLEKVIW
ncbi:hypothetical protein TRN7648_03904 [Tropicibacter naphthalenivorans]|uniref:Uncharacterized protein n=1 Tax=Tropicibacter naphthalenivorans TaxID=441103 RepID=A0A0P1GYY3_9RHOB|nr:hypothetical protein TRN7648_03904 [Tropicibacter naphthalenivorans]